MLSNGVVGKWVIGSLVMYSGKKEESLKWRVDTQVGGKNTTF